MIKTTTRDLNTIEVSEQTIKVKKMFGLFGTTMVPTKEVVGITVKRSMYDMPGGEQTLVLDMANGRRLKVKRLPKKFASAMAELIYKNSKASFDFEE